jgi:uncharacterized membrane protein YqaE (UPF0057 family)
MLVLLAILCPPVAVLLTAPPSQAAKNFGLTLLFYVPGMLHARSVVDRYYAHRQFDSLARLLESRTTPAPRRAA